MGGALGPLAWRQSEALDRVVTQGGSQELRMKRHPEAP